jgi:hypothetical protein
LFQDKDIRKVSFIAILLVLIYIWVKSLCYL